MTKFLVTLLLCSSVICASAQGMFGVQAGGGYTTGYKSRLTPAVEGYYLHKITHRLYAGGSVFYQRFSMLNTLPAYGSIKYGDVISIDHKSSYLFFSPKVDYGVGYRKYFHFHAALGLGLLAGGTQFTNTHLPYWTPPGGTPYGADTIAVNTTYNLPSSIVRLAFGASQRIPTRGYWNITLSQEAGIMPGSLSKGINELRTPYICFQIGIMHKYPMVFVEY